MCDVVEAKVNVVGVNNSNTKKCGEQTEGGNLLITALSLVVCKIILPHSIVAIFSLVALESNSLGLLGTYEQR